MGPFVIGVQAVRTVLRQAPERALALYTSHDPKKGGPLFDLAKKTGVSLHRIPEAKLSQMVETESHQGFALETKERIYHSLEALSSQEGPAFFLMLDQIFDPQNLGAILRSAECFGVSGVIWSKNRGTDITPSATKASAGASELVPLVRVSNLADSVLRLQSQGFEVVAAVAPSSGGEKPVESLFSFSFSPRTVLIVGSEGEGIQPLLCKRADRLLTIPLQGKTDSLNVSAATAVLLAFYTKYQSIS